MSAWSDFLANPLTLAIVGGILTLLTTIVTNYFSARDNRRAEAQKAALAEQSAREALQADLIKRFVESPSKESVRQNLRFLAEAGLIPSYADSILRYLDSTPDTVAPQIGKTLEFAAAGVTIADAQKQRIQTAAAQYQAFLRDAGFSGVEQQVTVFIFSRERPPSPDVLDADQVNAYYSQNTIFIHKDLSNSVSVALREYTHHILFAVLGRPATPQNEVESALADYLPASFLNTPIIGEGVGRALGLEQDYVRSLDGNTTYKDSGHPVSRGIAWAEALWSCRKVLGPQGVDGLLLPAWREAMKLPRSDKAIRQIFAKALVNAAAPAGACFAREFKRRKLL